MALHTRHSILDTCFQFLTMTQPSPGGLSLALGMGLAFPDSAAQSKLFSKIKTDAWPVVLGTSFAVGIFHSPLTSGRVWTTGSASTSQLSDGQYLQRNAIPTHSPPQISTMVIKTRELLPPVTSHLCSGYIML